jgi:hypothetical protein
MLPWYCAALSSYLRDKAGGGLRARQLISTVHTQARSGALTLFSLFCKALSHSLHPCSSIVLIGKPLQPNNGLSWYGRDLRKTGAIVEEHSMVVAEGGSEHIEHPTRRRGR